MIVLYDARMPQQAAEALAYYATAVPLITHGVTDDILSGHPDVFCCNIEPVPVVAPNMPLPVVQQMQQCGIDFVFGKQNTGQGKYANAHYNAVVSENYILHHIASTDESILCRCDTHKRINVKQSLTRCTTIALKNNMFITSDGGVYKQLKQNCLNVMYVECRDILLPGVKYGCIGGCMGLCEDTLFVIGSMKYCAQGDKMMNFVSNMGYRIIELYDGPLYDGGSLCFMQ